MPLNKLVHIVTMNSMHQGDVKCISEQPARVALVRCGNIFLIVTKMTQVVEVEIPAIASEERLSLRAAARCMNGRPRAIKAGQEFWVARALQVNIPVLNLSVTQER